MPGADLTPGFYGKLPSTGDFVSWNLPRSFTDRWDRWISAHVIARLARADALCFAAPAHWHALTGVVLASADRSGRRFPLTLAAPLPEAGPDLPAAAPWYAALAAAGLEATSGELDALGLRARLASLPSPPAAPGQPPHRLLLWTPESRPREADADHPGAVLDELLGSVTEAD